MYWLLITGLSYGGNEVAVYLTSVNHGVATRTFVLAVDDDELAYLARKWTD